MSGRHGRTHARPSGEGIRAHALRTALSMAVVVTTCVAHASSPTAAAAALLAARASASSISGAPISQQLDSATEQALGLQDAIDRAQEDEVALRQRIDVVNIRVMTQSNVVADAQGKLSTAQTRFGERVVALYKSGFASPFTLIVSSRSLADFYARAVLLSRILADDARLIRDAEVAEHEAEYQQGELDSLKSQLVLLRALLERRARELRFDLDQQKRLVATLSAANKAIVAERQTATARTRKEWRESSIPVGTPIGFAAATVDADPVPYLVSERQPRTYERAGEQFTAVCSWYGNEFNGRPTASGQIFNQDDLTCASRTLSFGTRVALERAGRRIIVVVTDRGPYVGGRDLDLSRAAARALGFSGVEPVGAFFVTATGSTSAAGAQDAAGSTGAR